MTERTIIGKRYVVESAAGCVVTSGRGRVLCDVAPGMAGKFVATDGRVVCSDPLAVVREAQELEALPAGGWFLYELSRELVGVLVGTTYRLWWREGLNKLFIMTQLTTDDINEQVLAVAAKYVPEGVTAEVYNVNKYAHCTNVDDMLAVNSDYKNDLTSEGAWVYELTSLTSTKNIFANSPIKSFAVKELPNVTQLQRLFYQANNIKELILELPNVVKIDSVAENCSMLEKLELRMGVANQQIWAGCVIHCANLREIKISGVHSVGFNSCFMYLSNLTRFETDAKEVSDLVQAFRSASKLKTCILDTSFVTAASWAFLNCSSLEVFPTEYPRLKSGKSMFSDCQLAADKAVSILQSIPAWGNGETHELGMGIHIDHQNDEEVLAAIANAEAKGWTLTVQWNGTPTAKASTTYRMRRQQPVYAKLAEDTEWSDGTIRPTLDWGHYVTNWQENGYMEFASLEEARENFNINE